MVTVDGFLPVVPSEAAVIGLNALSATGSPNLPALAAAVIGGGIAGDRIAYLLGRKAGSRVATGKLAEARAQAEKHCCGTARSRSWPAGSFRAGEPRPP